MVKYTSNDINNNIKRWVEILVRMEWWKKKIKYKKGKLHLWELLNRSGKFEVFWEQFRCMRVHQFVRLSDCYICNSCYISNLFLTSFVFWSLKQIKSVSTLFCYKFILIITEISSFNLVHGYSWYVNEILKTIL